MATRRGIVSLVGVALLLLSQGMEAATVPSADQQPSPLLSTAPYYRFWHGLKLDSLSTDAFRSSLQAFIAATTEVGEGIALVSYLPVLTPTPTAYKKLPGCGGASGWTETALVAYTSEEAYHQLMSSPRGRRYEHSHWNLFNISCSSSHVPPPQAAASPRLVVGNATDVLFGTTPWYAANTSALLVVHNRLPGSSSTAYAVAVNKYVDAVKQAVGHRALLSWVIRLDEDVVFEYQLWRKGQVGGNTATQRHAVSVALSYLSDVATLFANTTCPVGPMTAPISYGGGLSVQLPMIP